MFIRNAVWNSLGNAGIQVGQAIQALGARWLVPPAVMGLWELANLVRRVSSILDPGFLSAAQRDLPVLRGAGDHEGEVVYRSVSFWANVAFRLLIVAGVLVVWLVKRSQYTPAESAALFVGAGFVFLFGITEALDAFYQSAERYRAFGRATVTYSIVTTAVALAATYWWGIWGYMLGILGGLVLYVALLGGALERNKVEIRPVWRWDVFKGMARFAVPLRAADYPLKLIEESDVLLVARFLGLGPLAVYGTAKLVLSQGVQLPSWVGQVMILRLNTKVGANAPRGPLAAEMRRYLTFLDLAVLPALVSSAYFAFAILVPRFLPRYAGSVDVAGVTLLIMFFMPQTTLVRNVWIVEKRMLPLVATGLAAVGVVGAFLALWVFGLGRGWSLVGIAQAYLAGNITYYLVTMNTVGRSFLGSAASFRLQLGVVVAATLTAIAIGTIPLPLGPAFRSPLAVVLRVVLLLSPLVWIGINRSRMIPYLVDAIAHSRRQRAGGAAAESAGFQP